MQLLAGDTGGTKTLLLLAEAELTAADSVKLKPLFEGRYISAEFPNLTSLVKKFLTEATHEHGKTPAPEAACFSIAGPIVDNVCHLTNLAWLVDGNRMQGELSIPKIQLINDFTAVGYGIEGLGAADLHTLQAGEPKEDAPIAIIGAGTGLGQGFLIRDGQRYRVFSSEGGHTDFGPRTDLEFDLLKYAKDRLNLTRVSVERVVSGMGIVLIYQFLRDRNLLKESSEVGQAIRAWEQEAGMSARSIDPAAVIAKAAAEDQDPLSQETMKLFVSLYGAEAGNLALKLLPYGGLYIAGGIAAKNVPLMDSGIFIDAMAAKGRMRPLMARVPVHVILNQKVGLLGAALHAVRL